LLSRSDDRVKSRCSRSAPRCCRQHQRDIGDSKTSRFRTKGPARRSILRGQQHRASASRGMSIITESDYWFGAPNRATDAAQAVFGHQGRERDPDTSPASISGTPAPFGREYPVISPKLSRSTSLSLLALAGTPHSAPRSEIVNLCGSTRTQMTVLVLRRGTRSRYFQTFHLRLSSNRFQG
jgi:hypothetical protein